MKKHLLIGASLLALGITTTAIYAQVTGTSVVDKMKAVAHSFTLATTLNPSDSGLTSEPVKGKKTGDILTAGEYNRLLELVSEGGGSTLGGSGAAAFVTYKNFSGTTTTIGKSEGIQSVANAGTTPNFLAKDTLINFDEPLLTGDYAVIVSPSEDLSAILSGSRPTLDWVCMWNKVSDSSLGVRCAYPGYGAYGNSIVSVAVIKWVGGGGSVSPACPSGFVAIGSYCIEPTMSSTGKTWYEAAVACTDKGAQLCHWSEWSAACLKGKLTDVTFGASGKYEWIDDYSIGNQGIADPIVHSDCKYLSRQADTTAAANTGYRCCTSQK